MANSAYTWDEYLCAVEDYLLAGNHPVIDTKDVGMLTHCYYSNYFVINAYTAIMMDRAARRNT